MDIFDLPLFAARVFSTIGRCALDGVTRVEEPTYIETRLIGSSKTTRSTSGYGAGYVFQLLFLPTSF